jgi:hypothetical protein
VCVGRERQGFTIYRNSLTTDFYQPDCRNVYPEGDSMIFQQDGAASRTSKVTKEHLDEEVPIYIKKTSGRLSRPIAILWIVSACWTHSHRRCIGAALKNALRRNSSK